MPSLLRSVAAVVAATLLMCASESIAAAKTNGSWRFEITGASCIPDRAAIEHEITLACNAMRACSQAQEASEEDLVAVLDCSLPNGWTLETKTGKGALLSHTTLSGDRADRFRSVAIQIAHDAAQDEDEEPTPIDTEAALAPLVTISGEADKVPVIPETPPEKLALGLGIRGSTGNVAGHFGVRVFSGLHLARGVRATATFAGDANDRERLWRGGLGIAAGAPFDRSSIFGVAFEGGAGAFQYYGQPLLDRVTTKTDPTIYGQVMLSLQVPNNRVRPCLGFGALLASSPNDATRVSFVTELGFAFGVF